MLTFFVTSFLSSSQLSTGIIITGVASIGLKGLEPLLCHLTQRALGLARYEMTKFN